MALKIELFQMIFMDTAPFIYFFENNNRFADKVQELFQAVESGNAHIVTSLITYTEIITKPLKDGNTKLMEKYRAYFTGSKNMALLPFTIQCAEETARLRCLYNLKTPDAMQVASAIVCGADCIITNDLTWKRITEIPVFCLDDL